MYNIVICNTTYDAYNKLELQLIGITTGLLLLFLRLIQVVVDTVHVSFTLERSTGKLCLRT